MEKLAWPDRLRNLATILVVSIHVCAPIPMQGTDYNSSAWWTGNLWCSLGRPAVPLFVMLSGYLLFTKVYPLSYFLRKRFARVLIPALFWMPVYLLYNHLANHNPATWTDVVRHVIEGPVHYHLWFIYLIVGLYLTYPIIAPFVRQATDREMLFFFIMCFYGCWAYKILDSFFAVKPMMFVELFTNNAIYFVGGYYLAMKHCKDEILTKEPRFAPWPFTKKQMVGVAIALIMAGWAYTAIGSWYHSSQQGKFFPLYYDYLNPSVTLGAAGWFLLAKYTFQGSGTLAHWEQELSTASFGIYLVHPLLLDWWSQAGYWQDKFHPALCIPVVLAMVTMTCFMVVQLIRVVPGGDKVT